MKCSADLTASVQSSSNYHDYKSTCETMTMTTKLEQKSLLFVSTAKLACLSHSLSFVDAVNWVSHDARFIRIHWLFIYSVPHEESRKMFFCIKTNCPMDMYYAPS